MLRILHTLPDLQTGGGQMVLLRHLRHMDPERYEHHVCFFLPADDMRAQFEEIGVATHYIPHRGWRHIRSCLNQLSKCVDELDIRLIHSNGTTIDKLYGQIAALRAGIPLLNSLHGVKPRPRRPLGMLAYASRSIVELPLDRMTRLHEVAVSDPILVDWKARLRAGGVASGRQHVVYSGIPVDDYRRRLSADERRQLRAELGIEPGDLALITVTRLVQAKGLDMLVPMMQRLTADEPNARLLIVGDGDRRASLADEIRAAGLEDRMILLGRRTDVAPLLAAADLFVFPSLFEGFGLVVLEAMAAGLPVVAFDLPVLRILDEQDTGISLVTERSGEALAVRILDRARGPENLQEIGARAAATIATHWDVRRSAQAYSRLYDEIIALETPAAREPPPRDD